MDGFFDRFFGRIFWKEFWTVLCDGNPDDELGTKLLWAFRSSFAGFFGQLQNPLQKRCRHLRGPAAVLSFSQAVLDGVPPTGLQLLRQEWVPLTLWIKGLEHLEKWSKVVALSGARPEELYEYHAVLVAIVSQNSLVLVFVLGGGLSHKYRTMCCENGASHRCACVKLSNWGAANLPGKASCDTGHRSNSIAISRDMGPLKSPLKSFEYF